MLRLKISNTKELRLVFIDEDISRFAMCRLEYVDKDNRTDICEDYLYIFVENILGRIKNIPTIGPKDIWGRVGKWQEYFYYDSQEIELYEEEIKIMKQSLLVSAECFGIFVYKFEERIWLEINRGYREECGLSPVDYYSEPLNYRVLLTEIEEVKMGRWQCLLDEVNDMCK